MSITAALLRTGLALPVPPPALRILPGRYWIEVPLGTGAWPANTDQVWVATSRTRERKSVPATWKTRPSGRRKEAGYCSELTPRDWGAEPESRVQVLATGS